MDKKKVDLGAAAHDMGKNALELLSKTRDSIIHAVDQNDDGFLDLKDVSMIAETIGNTAKNTASAMKDSAEARSREVERRILQPIFVADLDRADFMLSKLIRVTEIDKKHAESDVCKDSIGFISCQKDLRVINIYRDKVSAFGLSFYPDAEGEVYYVDPSDRDKYISLDDYFNHLKTVRIDELQKIAQDLGAKHFRVVYKEQKTTFSKNAVKAKASSKVTGNAANAEGAHDLDASSIATIEVAAEMTCPGHTPSMPELHYLQRESSILNLIAMRMDENSPLTHQKFTLKLSNSSSIREKDALKIDAALKAMKLQGNTTVVSEVRNEARRFFEYEIDF